MAERRWWHSRKRDPRGQYAPDLWRVWLVAALFLIAAGGVGVGMYALVYHLMKEPGKPMVSAERQRARSGAAVATGRQLEASVPNEAVRRRGLMLLSRRGAPTTEALSLCHIRRPRVTEP
jgi:hypothetical protein